MYLGATFAPTRAVGFSMHVVRIDLQRGQGV